ncbi:unnamed protein product [Caenorhabditis angaria]|uniref:Sm domain-containing protein n=1 Tax=Caenorhabditis angaria TaxID=860376 RepID=A0A9P1I372_9PELO|nr:unnamed protein product [Caenorhabditis angaria]
MLADEDDGFQIAETLVVEEKEEESEACKKVREYLSKRYEIHLTDTRIIRGTLNCTDKDANMLFYESDERWPEGETRWLGQAMIAKKHVIAMYEIKPAQETSI